MLKLITEANQLMDNRKSKKNKNKIPHLVFIDLKSAFDTVNWQVLGTRMRSY